MRTARISNVLLVLVFLILSNCIGTDYIDDPIVGAMLEIDVPKESLMVGETMQLTYSYSNEYGLPENVQATWFTSTLHVQIDKNGLLTALSKGQTEIYAVYDQTESPSKRITIVEAAGDVASVEISYSTKSMEVGQTQLLEARVKNLGGAILKDKEVTWSSSDTSVISVNSSGLALAKDLGVAEITATSEGIKSSPLMLRVGDEIRSGEFVPNGYTAEGSVMLSYNETEELVLNLSSDFKTSFALGTFIYLSNSKEGGATKTSGLEIAEITTNGAKEFNVSSIDNSVHINTYDYVIILCKPAAITFGYAELKP